MAHWLGNTALKFAFLDREKRCFAQTQASNLPTNKNFNFLGSKMTSQLTLDCPIYSYIFTKTTTVETRLQEFSGDINKVLLIKNFYNNLR